MLTVEVFLATMSSLVVVATAAFLWILSEFRAMRRDNRAELEKVRDENRTELQKARDENRAELQKVRDDNKEEHRITREEIRAESRRILEALYFHRHDPNTNEAVFYPPTPAPPAAD